MFLRSHPTIWKLIKGLRRDIWLHALILAQSQVQSSSTPRGKYRIIAESMAVYGWGIRH